MYALNAVEGLAMRSARALERLFVPDSSATPSGAAPEGSMNTAVQDLYSKGPLLRARRAHAAATSSGAASLLPALAAALIVFPLRPCF